MLKISTVLYFSARNTVSSVLEAAASDYFDVILDQILLSKKCVLLWLLFEGGFYLRAASNTEFTVLNLIEQSCIAYIQVNEQ